MFGRGRAVIALVGHQLRMIVSGGVSPARHDFDTNHGYVKMQIDPQTLAHGRDGLDSELGYREASHLSNSPAAEVITQRRASPRYKVELDVSLNSEHNFYVGFVENLSVTGVFIATHMLKDVGQTLELYIHLPNSDVVVQALGEVRWVREFCEQNNTPPGMGVRFQHLEPGCEGQIVEFLSSREPLFFDDD